MTGKGVVAFGDFRLDFDDRELTRSGESIRLTPKAVDLLIHLVRNRGRIVTKEELLEAVWDGRFVEEGILNKNVSTLRRALGEEPGENSYIETVARRGYRFLAPVRGVEPGEAPVPQAPLPAVPPPLADALEERSSAAGSSRATRRVAVALVLVLGSGGGAAVWARARWSPPAASPPSVAVLPFRLLDGAQDASAIGLGMADAVVTRLGASHAVIVRPTSAVVRFAGGPFDPVKAGRELDVSYVLDGRGQRAGAKVRFTVQLLRTSDGLTLWADTFDEAQGDFFAVQDSISRKVALGVGKTIGLPGTPVETRHYTKDPEAFALFVRGRYLWSQRPADPAPPEGSDPRLLFRRAIERDPDFAMAYVGLADCLAFDGFDGGGWKEAEDLALRALAIDDRLGEAWATLGFVRTYYRYDWEGAGAAFDKAVSFSPNDAVSHQWRGAWLALQGRLPEARAALVLAAQIDPLAPAIASDLAELHYFEGEPDEALREWRAVLARHRDFAPATAGVLWTLLLTGRVAEAEAFEQGPGAAAGVDGPEPPVPGLARFDRVRTVRELFRPRPGVLPPAAGSWSSWPQARLFASVGDRDRALAALEEARDGHAFFAVYAKVEPAFRFLHGDPRWQAVVRSIGLTP